MTTTDARKRNRDMRDAHETAQARDAAWMLGALDGTSGPRDRTHDDQETDMDDRKYTTDQCQADPRTHSERALDHIADRLHDVLLELRVGPIPDTLTEIRDRLPERVEVNLEAFKHEAETPMRGHGECCDNDGSGNPVWDASESYNGEPAPADVDPDEAGEKVPMQMDLERCVTAKCDYPEPHNHGFACGPDCPCGEGVQARESRWKRRQSEAAQEAQRKSAQYESEFRKAAKEQARAEKAEADLARVTEQRDRALDDVQRLSPVRANADDLKAKADRYDALRHDVWVESEVDHRPVEIEPSGTICGHCSWRLPNGRFFGQVVDWPCETAALLNPPTEGETDHE